MARIEIDGAVHQILAVLKETFEGAAEDWTYFTDHGSDISYSQMLPKINAADASRKIGGTTIASHVHHIVFSLNEASSFIQGDTSPRDWKQSWQVDTVDESSWSALLNNLGKGYSDLQKAIQTNATDSIESFGAVAGFLAHSAYHLGAIRQKVWLLRN